MKKIPYRMCVVTKEKYPKQELIRIVINKEGQVFVDPTGKMNGKGVYLKKDIDVLKKAESTKILNKVLNCDISDEIFDELKSIIGE